MTTVHTINERELTEMKLGEAIGDIAVVLGLVSAAIFGTSSIASEIQRYDTITLAANDIEEWSVANPSHPLSYQNTFSLEEFAGASGSTYNISDKYNVVRPAGDQLCFLPKETDDSEGFSYSFVSEKILTEESCGNS